MTEVADNTLVDGRYRIVERIGSGGMADVYRAEDTHLGREVALKILHRRFAQDAEFVERFRREAKSAAGLQHPGVVGIFDRGEHDATYYIAMEHVPGRTLKELIRGEGPLPQQRAIDLGIQILQAAGFAHRRGVIHRDLKSGNVMLDEEGNAKVTDFGIARAGTSEMTETGSIMGTAQYLSPEQAQGHAVTAASDLYSIGVILYEMLAGRLPFEGDSAVSVALKHLSEPPPPLSRFRPDVSPVLESVVMGALAKDPAARWRSADELAAALEAAKGQLEPGPNGGQDTAAFAPVPLPVEEPAIAETGPAPDGPPAPAPLSAVRERRRRWPLLVLGAMVLALAALLAYLAISGLTSPPQVTVPKAVGKQVLQARALVRRAGFKVKQVSVPSASEFGLVVGQDPSPGDEADEGSTVTLEVSRGPGTVRVPSIKGLPRDRAVKELNKAGLKFTLDERPSESVRDGFAIGTVPKEGAPVERGTRVRLFISSGPEKVTVPGVVGLSRGSAEAQLGGKGLEVVVREQPSDQPAGQVIAQSPSAGTHVQRGTRVTITVAVARQRGQGDVPDVVGLSAGDAAGALRAAGFGVARREKPVTDEDDDGTVVAQHPGAGAQADKGSSVVIVVGKFKEPKPQPQRETEPPPGPQPPVP